MNKKELGLFLAVAAATGFVGGHVGRFGSYVSIARADQAAQEVVAHRFLLVDDAGNGRAQLAINQVGIAFFSLYDGNGKVRTVMGVTPDGRYAQLTFFDPNGKVIAIYPHP